MRVVQVTHHFLPCIGGVERVVLYTAQKLVKEGHKCRVVCLDRCHNSEKLLPSSEKFKGIEIKRIPFSDLKYYKVAPRVLDFIKDADLVHVHGIGFFSDYLLLTKHFHRKPIVVSTHGGVFHTKKLLPIKWLYFNLWNRVLLRRADRVVAVSKNDFRIFSKLTKKISLVENGVDVERLLKLKRAAEKGLFVFIGRITSSKRIDLLLKAFAVVKEEQPFVRLAIVGEDFDGTKKKLLGLVKKLGLENCVEFAGNLTGKELDALMSRAEFFASASEYEGFGISAIEAMAAGEIVFLNNIDSFRNFVKHKENGFLVDFSDPETAGLKISEALDSGRERLEKIRKNAVVSVQKYSLNNSFNSLMEVYNSVAEK